MTRVRRPGLRMVGAGLTPVEQGLGDGRPRPAAPPRPPPRLSKDARKEWFRLLPLLRHAALLQVDADVLGLLCEALATLNRASAEIQAGGFMVDTPNHYKIQSPWIPIRTRASKEVADLCDSLGMSPASRLRGEIEGKTPDDAFEAYLQRGRDLRQTRAKTSANPVPKK